MCANVTIIGPACTFLDIHQDEVHIAAVLHALASTDAAKLRSFWGLLSWYDKFIPNFAAGG